VALAALAVAGVCGFGASSASAALFGQCPPVGNNQGCSQLIVVNPDGTVVVKVDPAAPPSGYDGVEDTLIGLQNNSGHSISSINLASPSAAIFSFDSDGLCDPPDWPSAPAVIPPNCPGTQGFGPTGYEGPNNTFTNLSPNLLTGTVQFTSPIPPGGSAYWGLEEALQAGQLLSGAGGAPITSAPQASGQSVSFSMTCVGANPCNGVAQLLIIEHLKGKVWVARRHKPRTRKVVVGSTSVSVPAGGTAPIKVSLNKAGRKLLSTVQSLPVQVQVKLGGQATQVGNVKLKGHKPRKRH
jgi:hypothetical protein